MLPIPEPKPGFASTIPVPVVYEDGRAEQISLRAWAAIQLRVPDSGIAWLDRMIEKSRALDRRDTHRSGA
jgi:hypothetical protein